MKTAITAIATILIIASTVSYAHAEVPAWVKNNAGWWADGTISESEFLTGIEFLIGDGIITVPSTTVSTTSSSEGVPAWVKNNAGWWADGVTSDGEFVNAIQHLMSIGLISVTTESSNDMVPVTSTIDDSELAALEAELEACSEITKAYKRLDCEKPIKKAIMLYEYKKTAQKFEVGPINYYWQGIGTEGSEFKISPTGQAILSIRMLAENTSSDIATLNCTSPQICNYDVWDGTTSFKYSGMDFTSGQISINPGDTREFNMLFGPNIGYGGTQFLYDPSLTYHFRISEGFGSASVLLDLE
ncbi:peptidase [Nitrosopumilus sp. S6]